jgi:hypothetical protein
MNNVFPTELLKNRIKELETNFEFENYMFSEDVEFASKLKAFYSNYNFRRTGRTFLLLRILVEQAIESGEYVSIMDHIEMYESNNNRRAIQYANSELRNVIHFYINQGIDLRVEHRNEHTFRVMIYNGHNFYNKVRIKPYTPEYKRKEEFSKLLLII